MEKIAYTTKHEKKSYFLANVLTLCELKFHGYYEQNKSVPGC